MSVYMCKCCSFDTTIKSQYETHLLTKKHNRLMNENVNIVCDPVADAKDKRIAELTLENAGLRMLLDEWKSRRTDKKGI